MELDEEQQEAPEAERLTAGREGSLAAGAAEAAAEEKPASNGYSEEHAGEEQREQRSGWDRRPSELSPSPAPSSPLSSSDSPPPPSASSPSPSPLPAAPISVSRALLLPAAPSPPAPPAALGRYRCSGCAAVLSYSSLSDVYHCPLCSTVFTPCPLYTPSSSPALLPLSHSDALTATERVAVSWDTATLVSHFRSQPLLGVVARKAEAMQMDGKYFLEMQLEDLIEELQLQAQPPGKERAHATVLLQLKDMQRQLGGEEGASAATDAVAVQKLAELLVGLQRVAAGGSVSDRQQPQPPQHRASLASVVSVVPSPAPPPASLSLSKSKKRRIEKDMLTALNAAQAAQSHSAAAFAAIGSGGGGELQSSSVSAAASSASPSARAVSPPAGLLALTPAAAAPAAPPMKKKYSLPAMPAAPAPAAAVAAEKLAGADEMKLEPAETAAEPALEAVTAS